MPVYELISEIIQDVYPDMSPTEADEQALEIFYNSEAYLHCLDELLTSDYE